MAKRYVWVAIAFVGVDEDDPSTDVLGVYLNEDTAWKRARGHDREGWIERHELRGDKIKRVKRHG